MDACLPVTLTVGGPVRCAGGGCGRDRRVQSRVLRKVKRSVLQGNGDRPSEPQIEDQKRPRADIFPNVSGDFSLPVRPSFPQQVNPGAFTDVGVT